MVSANTTVFLCKPTNYTLARKQIHLVLSIQTKASCNYCLRHLILSLDFGRLSSQNVQKGGIESSPFLLSIRPGGIANLQFSETQRLSDWRKIDSNIIRPIEERDFELFDL